MARINIEECWWSDPRREKLAKLVGCDLAGADGICVQMWRLAQEFWGRGEELVPLHIFESLQANTNLIQANLAVVQANGVYVRGSSVWLDWVNKRRSGASKGGKKSSQRPRDSKGRLVKKPKNVQAKSKHIQASGSGSVSGSDSDSGSGNLLAPILSGAPEINPVSFYCDLWKAKHGKSPDIRGKEAGQISQLVKDVGLPRTLQIMKSYFSMPDPFFIKRSYNLDTMLLNLATIAQFEATGKIITREVITQVEKKVDKLQGTKTRRSIEEIEADETGGKVLLEVAK